jgi:hypothetical protein
MSTLSSPNRTSTWTFIAAIVTAALYGLSQCELKSLEENLPALGTAIDETTVSGISSGAYMAGQFQVAHSKIVKGAAIIAGGPYGCAESAFAGVLRGRVAEMVNATKAVSGCMQNAMALWGVPNPALLADKTESLAKSGAIDPVDGVKEDRVYLFSGQSDRLVVPAIVEAARDYYMKLGVPAAQIKFVSDLPAGHGFVTESAGASCERTAEPFVVDCDYDQAKDLLTHVYGALEPPSHSLQGQYVPFDQWRYGAGSGATTLSERGTVYVPDACRTAQCRVHIAFHGCAQNETAVGDAFVKRTGFARWADTNRIVVLFPQAKATPSNPQGCWDWWGFTSPDYLTKGAPQILATYGMLQRLSALPESN